METVKLPGVGTITTFDPVTKDFDPFTATDNLLRRYGFPFGKWRNRWGRPKEVIQPTFRVMDYKHRLVPRKRLPIKPPVPLTQLASDWSGAIVNPAPQDTINSVEGVWTIPDCELPAHPMHNVWYTASSWVGIDHGEGNSPDILQMGVDSNVQMMHGSVQYDIRAWSEWCPALGAWVSNFPVSAGDKLNALIVVDESSRTAATMYLLNETLSIAVSFILSAPQHKPPIQLVGDCAEWIVEALRIPPAPTWELGRYGVLCFDGAKAGTVNGEILLAGSGDTIDMIDSNQNIISQGSINSSMQVQCKYVGP